MNNKTADCWINFHQNVFWKTETFCQRCYACFYCDGLLSVTVTLSITSATSSPLDPKVWDIQMSTCMSDMPFWVHACLLITGWVLVRNCSLLVLPTVAFLLLKKKNQFMKTFSVRFSFSNLLPVCIYIYIFPCTVFLFIIYVNIMS